MRVGLGAVWCALVAGACASPRARPAQLLATPSAPPSARCGALVGVWIADDQTPTSSRRVRWVFAADGSFTNSVEEHFTEGAGALSRCVARVLTDGLGWQSQDTGEQGVVVLVPGPAARYSYSLAECATPATNDAESSGVGGDTMRFRITGDVLRFEREGGPTAFVFRRASAPVECR